jgi:hypothetical protein
MNPALTLQFERAVNEYARWQAVPAEDRSDAPAWWWDAALAAVDETAATIPVEWCAILGVAAESTYAEGAEVFRNTLLRQTDMPYSENFPRKFKAPSPRTSHVLLIMSDGSTNPWSPF